MNEQAMTPKTRRSFFASYDYLADLLSCYGAPGEPDKLREWLSERLDAAVPAKNIVALSCAGMAGEHAGATLYFCERHGKELMERVSNRA